MILKLINNLQKFGFTENEAKIYAALVCLNKATAREIYETSGVPRSKVYKILRGMEEKGYVHTTEMEPVHFICIHPDELISRIKFDFLLSLDETFCGLCALILNNETPSSGRPAELGMKC